MSTKKQPEVVRRVWRMTAEAPAGEYLDLELVPKEIAGKSSTEAAPRRTLHPETPPAYRKVPVASDPLIAGLHRSDSGSTRAGAADRSAASAASGTALSGFAATAGGEGQSPQASPG